MWGLDSIIVSKKGKEKEILDFKIHPPKKQLFYQWTEYNPTSKI